MYLSSRKCVSLNDVKNMATIFTCIPPIAYGKLLADNKYTSKKLRCFMINRYYNYNKLLKTG